MTLLQFFRHLDPFLPYQAQHMPRELRQGLPLLIRPVARKRVCRRLLLPSAASPSTMGGLALWGRGGPGTVRGIQRTFPPVFGIPDHLPEPRPSLRIRTSLLLGSSHDEATALPSPGPLPPRETRASLDASVSHHSAWRQHNLAVAGQPAPCTHRPPMLPKGLHRRTCRSTFSR